MFRLFFVSTMLGIGGIAGTEIAVAQSQTFTMAQSSAMKAAGLQAKRDWFDHAVGHMLADSDAPAEPVAQPAGQTSAH